MPEFKKVDEHTIEVTIAKSNSVPLYKIMETKKELERQIAETNETLKNVNEILNAAKRLGITVKYPPKKENKS